MKIKAIVDLTVVDQKGARHVKAGEVAEVSEHDGKHLIKLGQAKADAAASAP